MKKMLKLLFYVFYEGAERKYGDAERNHPLRIILKIWAPLLVCKSVYWIAQNSKKKSLFSTDNDFTFFKFI